MLYSEGQLEKYFQLAGPMAHPALSQPHCGGVKANWLTPKHQVSYVPETSYLKAVAS